MEKAVFSAIPNLLCEPIVILIKKSLENVFGLILNTNIIRPTRIFTPILYKYTILEILPISDSRIKIIKIKKIGPRFDPWGVLLQNSMEPAYLKKSFKSLTRQKYNFRNMESIATYAIYPNKDNFNDLQK